MQKESLLVLKDWGVELRTRYYVGCERRIFVPREQLRDVVINEGFLTWSVIYYLAFIIEDDQQQPALLLPFEVCLASTTFDAKAVFTTKIIPQHLLPRLDVLLPIYQDTWMLLFSDTRENSEAKTVH